MKIPKKHQTLWLPGGLALAALSILAAWKTFGQSVPQPGLTIVQTSTNDFLIRITNGVTFANYEIYRRQLLDAAYPRTLHLIGSMGQSNFTVGMGIDTIGFFQAAVGSDWDQDGYANWFDGDPSNPSVGTLSISIDSPTNTMVFN